MGLVHLSLDIFKDPLFKAPSVEYIRPLHWSVEPILWNYPVSCPSFSSILANTDSCWTEFHNQDKYILQFEKIQFHAQLSRLFPDPWPLLTLAGLNSEYGFTADCHTATYWLSLSPTMLSQQYWGCMYRQCSQVQNYVLTMMKYYWQYLLDNTTARVTLPCW